MGVSRSVNTMAEGLQNVLSEVSRLKLAPDADLAFLTSLETTLLSYMRQPIEAMSGQLPPNQMPTNNPGMQPPAPSGAPSMPPSPMAARLAGMGGNSPVGPPGPPPNMDEIRRMMG